MTADLARLKSSSISRRAWIPALIALALVIRLAALLLAWGTSPTGDPENYIGLAHHLLSGDGLALPRPAIGPEPVPTALFPPVLPLLLAAIGLVAPLNALTLCIFNTLIDGIAALLLARLARMLGAPKAAVPAALGYLLWPSIALMSPLAYKEGLVIALLLGITVCALEQARHAGFQWALASGLCAGALILTQPALVTLMPILFLALSPQFPNWKQWLSVSLAAAITTLLVMLPWWIRNAQLFGHFIPLTTSGGLSFWVGAHPSGGVVWKLPPAAWYHLSEIEASRVATSEAWRVIWADPAGYFFRCLAKFPSSFFYSNWAFDQLINARGQRWPELGYSTLLRFGPTMLELWAVVMAAIGAIRLRREPAARLLWACVAQVVLFGIWFEFSERHRMFMTPFLLLVAAQLVIPSRQVATTSKAIS